MAERRKLRVAMKEDYFKLLEKYKINNSLKYKNLIVN